MERLAKSMPESEQAKGIPLQRWGRVREIADATVYLFCETGGFVNGAEVVVDGGAWRMAGRGPQVVEYVFSSFVCPLSLITFFSVFSEIFRFWWLACEREMRM